MEDAVEALHLLHRVAHDLQRAVASIGPDAVVLGLQDPGRGPGRVLEIVFGGGALRDEPDDSAEYEGDAGSLDADSGLTPSSD